MGLKQHDRLDMGVRQTCIVVISKHVWIFVIIALFIRKVSAPCSMAYLTWVLNKRILSFCQLPSYLWFHFLVFLTRPTVKYLPVILYCLASADGRDTAVEGNPQHPCD